MPGRDTAPTWFERDGRPVAPRPIKDKPSDAVPFAVFVAAAVRLRFVAHPGRRHIGSVKHECR